MPMPSSPISDPSSYVSNAAAEHAVDNNLQPFFVLHRASPPVPLERAPGSGKTRRKIDLSGSSPNSPGKTRSAVQSEDTDAIYERLRLEAFNITWSKIDTSIKKTLRQINLNVFDKVQGWVRESFALIRSNGIFSASEIERPYPLVTESICKQIPTAFILTKNAEFADDQLTFQELGGHLRSNGCHVANLSALDFSSKHGLGGCLRGLLRQLVTEPPDVSDIAVLASWYCEPANYDNPIVVIVDDTERCDSTVLAEFNKMLSEWVIKIPIVFIMGVATTVDALREILLSDALKHFQACNFTLGSPSERMDAIVESVLVKPCSGFKISHGVAMFLRNFFVKHDGTITSFVRALKLSCAKHFIEEPLSFLGPGILDEDSQAKAWHGKCKALPDNLRSHAFGLPSHQRDIIYKGTGLAEGLSELRRLQMNWSSVVMCLFEVGKLHKIQLIDIFCEVVNPDTYNLPASDHRLPIHSSTDHDMVEGKFEYAREGFIAQVIHKIRDLPLTSLFCLLSLWRIHTKEMTEVHEKVRELQSEIGSVDGGKRGNEAQLNIRKRSAYTSSRKGTQPVNDKAVMLLENMVRKFMVPIECIPFHEIVCFKGVGVLQTALIGDPRRTIQIDLLKPQTHLQCSCCGEDDNVLSSSMHDTSIMYNLAQEYGDLINIHDWYQSFKGRVANLNTKSRRKTSNSPASKKAKAVVASENEATIQARFCRAVIELQITGLLRMPSKRRPDFVQRVAFGL